MTSRIFWVVVCTFVAVLGQASAQPLSLKSVSGAQALRIVEAARAKCRELNLGDISVAVVDRAGNVKVLYAADNANPHSVELAQRKAYTARTFRMATSAWASRTAPGQEQNGQRGLSQVIPLGGGVPVLSGQDAIGGVGVSGSSGGQPGDEGCAKAGADAVAGQ
jgi:uncharacterized protein GlcG (DUF336 family)